MATATKKKPTKLTDPTSRRRKPAARGKKPQGLAESVAARPVTDIPIGDIARHPDNRAVGNVTHAADLQTIGARGLDEPIVVRSTPKGPTNYQLISGERRWTFCRDVLKWPRIPAHVLPADDRQALALLAAYNVRQNLTPTERGRLIVRLTSKDGADLTLKDAGQIFGLTKSAASELTDLVDLPASWQKRIDAGDWPRTAARALRHIAPHPRLVKLLEQFCRDEDYYLAGASREDLEALARRVVREGTRPIEAKDKPLTDHRAGPRKFGRLFEAPDEAARKALDVAEIVTVDHKGQAQRFERAFNTEDWDELQEPHLAERIAKAGQPAATTAAAVADAKAAGDPAAAERARNKAAADRTRERVEGWRHRFLCWAAAQALGDDWKTTALAPVLLAHCDHRYSREAMIRAAHELQTKRKGKPGRLAGDLADAVVQAIDPKKAPQETADFATLELCRLILWPAHPKATKAQGIITAGPVPMDARLPIPRRLTIEKIAAWLGVVDVKAWHQAKGSGKAPACPALVREFFEHHTREQLVTLAGELGATVTTTTKAELVELLAGLKSPTMPKAIGKAAETIKTGPLAGPPKKKKA